MIIEESKIWIIVSSTFFKDCTAGMSSDTLFDMPTRATRLPNKLYINLRAHIIIYSNPMQSLNDNNKNIDSPSF